jgi:NAD(P)-dependent dehydrogenase (short-subunit alcohol dehydrogenase family)
VRIAMTGASGLIGSALRRDFEASGHTVLRLGRGPEAAAGTLRWDPERLVHLLAALGLGGAAKEMAPAEFQKISAPDHMRLAYELGRRAFQENPDCDAIYIGGGTWLAEPVAERLEQEFGKPAICNQTAQLRDILQTLKAWQPMTGQGRVLAAA